MGRRLVGALSPAIQAMGGNMKARDDGFAKYDQTRSQVVGGINNVQTMHSRLKRAAPALLHVVEREEEQVLELALVDLARIVAVEFLERAPQVRAAAVGAREALDLVAQARGLLVPQLGERMDRAEIARAPCARVPLGLRRADDSSVAKSTGRRPKSLA